MLGISQSAFYRKIKEPQRFLTIAEKQAIARIYQLKETYLFPELEDNKCANACGGDCAAAKVAVLK